MPVSASPGREWRVYAVLAAATFSQHVGLLFLFVTVPATLRQQGASLSQVGLFAFVFVPFALQFLWAPVVEARRQRSAEGWRPWFFGTQAALVVGFGALALVPLATQSLPLLIALAVALALAAGTQKIAMGGLAIEALTGGQRAAGNGALGAGSALGSIAGTIGLTRLYAEAGWTTALIVASAATLAAGAVYVAIPRARSEVGASQPAPSLRHLFRLASTWRRLLGLALIALPLGLALGLVQPHLTDAGFDLPTIGLVNGLGQLAAWLLVAPIVTFGVGRFGVGRTQVAALLGAGVILALVAAGFPLQLPASWTAVAAAVTAFVALIGVSIATYTRMMRGAEDGGQAATEFSVYLSVYGLVILCGAGLSGVIAERVGYAPVLALAAAMITLSAGALSWLTPQEPASTVARKAAE